MKCIYLGMYIGINAFLCFYVNGCKHIRVFLCKYIYVLADMYISMYKHTHFIYTDIDIGVCTNISICNVLSTYIHTYVAG